MNSNKETIQLLKRQVAAYKKEKQTFRKNEELFQSLVETAVGDIGQDFFDNIVIKLSEWLNAECIIIGQMVGENTVEGFPMYLDGEIIHGFTYQLKDTPCDLTTKKGYCVYEDNLKQLFPLSKDVQELQARGYMGTALYNKNGEPNGVLCAMSRKKLELPQQAEGIIKIVGARISSEIERKETQKKLELSEQELRTANAAKDKFFSIIAHDLRSPYNSLLGFSQVLIKSINNNNIGKAKKCAQLINTISEQSYSLLNNLLDWSLSHTKRLKYCPEKLEFNELSTQMTTYFSSIAQNKKISFKTDNGNTTSFYADRNMINTILRNLISNALKYTPQAGTITLSASNTKEGILFAVMDTGIGIEANELKKLFQIEECVNTRGLNNEKGTGLGLILCKDFVELHKGRIWAESEPGQGSIFKFNIPCKN